MAKFDLNEPAEALEELLDKVTDYLKEYAKHKAGATCYNITNVPAYISQDLFDGLLADKKNTLERMADAYDTWDNAVNNFSQVIHDKNLTPQERTVLALKYLDGKTANEIMTATGYANVDALLNSAKAKTDKITSTLKIPENPIEAFLDELLPNMSIDVAPWQLLLDMYRGWGRFYFNSTELEFSDNRNLFIEEVQKVIDSSSYGWAYTVLTSKRTKTKKAMYSISKKDNVSSEEPFLKKFGCTNWMMDSKNDPLHLKKISRKLRGVYRM